MEGNLAVAAAHQPTLKREKVRIGQTFKTKSAKQNQFYHYDIWTGQASRHWSSQLE